MNESKLFIYIDILVWYTYLHNIKSSRFQQRLPFITNYLLAHLHFYRLTVTVASQQLDNPFHLCCAFARLYKYVKCSGFRMFLLHGLHNHQFFFDFESKIKPRVPYHRDHPPKKHELWRSYQWVWFFFLAADYLINKRSEMFTWDSRCADFVGWEQWNRKSHSQWYSTPSDTPIEKKW